MTIVSALIMVMGIASGLEDFSQVNQASAPTYSRDILPIFEERCSKCHTKKSKGRFSVNSRAAVLAGGKSGEVVIPGDSANSLLYRMLTGEPDLKSMPRKRKPLDSDTLALVKEWIDQGAK